MNQPNDSGKRGWPLWEVFVRPAKSSTWQLVTPPGVADNGGLVAAAEYGLAAAAQQAPAAAARRPAGSARRVPAGRAAARYN